MLNALVGRKKFTVLSWAEASPQDDHYGGKGVITDLIQLQLPFSNLYLLIYLCSSSYFCGCCKSMLQILLDARFHDLLRLMFFFLMIRFEV